MHARIDQLLSLRDEEPVDAHVAQHVQQCASCTSQLRQLSQLREQLQALPQLDAAAVSWEQIQSRLLLARKTHGRRRLGVLAAMSAIAVLSILIGIAVRKQEQPRLAEQAAESRAQAATSGEPVAELVAQSRHLEELLLTLPQRPQVERVSTTATIDSLEQRIQWLDYQLSYAPDSALNDEQAQRLWAERVELMDSLVKVRYAEARRVSF